MILFISNYIGFTHLIISALLVGILTIFNTFLNKIQIRKIMLFICSTDLIFYNLFILKYKFPELINFLPLHLCYLTEIMIFFSLTFNLNKYTKLIFLNSLVGGLAGLVNTNLTSNMHFIFHLHHYLAHFVLLLFVTYKIKYLKLNIQDILLSIFQTSIFLFTIIMFNNVFNTNYWFTRTRPNGKNLTLLFPEHPYYLIILVILGLIIYFSTYLKLKTNNNSSFSNANN